MQLFCGTFFMGSGEIKSNANGKYSSKVRFKY